MKITTILGARPQFIKAGSVSRAIKKYNDCTKEGQPNIQEILVHTGQHYDANMSDVFFEEMKIPRPDYFLGIGGKTHGAMTGQMIEKIEEILLKEKPDYVLVYGDTDSTLAGAIASSKLHIPIAHVEAGLRSFNTRMPEEINRILTDRVSHILFCPTEIAVQNLHKEGYPNRLYDNHSQKISHIGDVMQDGAIFYKQFAKKPSLSLQEGFVLCTIHRAENTDDRNRLMEIFHALQEIAKERQVLLPLHPRTRNILQGLNYNFENITTISPVGYLEMVWLIMNCSLVMTDSGGLQKEAYFFRKPCLTLRDETEWVELVEHGFNTIVGTNKKNILHAFFSAQNSHFQLPESRPCLYGDGKASERIVQEILE